MRPHRTCSIAQPDTYLYINEYIDIIETSAPIPVRRTTQFPRAILALTVGLGLAILVMLGTWWSLSTRTTARVTTFVAQPEEQPLSAYELEAIGLPPISLDDFLTHF